MVTICIVLYYTGILTLFCKLFSTKILIEVRCGGILHFNNNNGLNTSLLSPLHKTNDLLEVRYNLLLISVTCNSGHIFLPRNNLSII